MKPFDLKEALAGKPCVSKNGYIIHIFKDVREFGVDDDAPLVGIIMFNKSNYLLTRWSEDGNNLSFYDYQIVGMYEEPELTSEQVLEKAYQEDLKVSLDGRDVYIIIGKAKDGSYLLGSEKSDSYVAWSEDFGCPGIYLDVLAPKSNTITVTLPKPFKPKPNDKFWFIDKVGGHLQVSHKIKSNHALTGDGNYFRTKSDAQAWLDAMKNALDD